jgi:hypothetical protein
MKFIAKVLLLLIALSPLTSLGVLADNGQDVQELDATSADTIADQGELIYVVTTGNRLRSFFANSPNGFRSDVPIRGLQKSEDILGIDFRPATGELYGLGSTSRLYRIDERSGKTSIVGGQLAIALRGTAFGFDFNPTVDRIRVVSDAGQNFRLNPDTGAVVDFDTNTPGLQLDGNLVYNGTDRNSGAAAQVVGAAYTNNFLGAPSTVLYTVDANLDILAVQNPPNNGVLNTVGTLGVDVTKVSGFDISTATRTAYAAVLTGNKGLSKFASVDLTTGVVTVSGVFGGVEQIRGLSVPVRPETIVGLTPSNKLVTFASGRPGSILSSIDVTGLQSGESLLGIDFRPANKKLYGLGSSSRLYVIDPATGAATAVGASAFVIPLNGTVFGFDFNPQADRARIVSDARQNLRVNPDTGAVVDFDPNTAGVQSDLDLAFVGADQNAAATPNVVAAAYTNNVAGATSTILYDIDSSLDVLATQNPPNNGALNTTARLTVGSVSIGAAGLAGFDIAPVKNAAFASLSPTSDNLQRFYTLNLATGAAALVGVIGSGTPIVDIAVRIN